MAGVPSPSRKRRAALAFKAHIGWAYGVLVAEADGSIEIVAKQRVTMRETFKAAAVYHVGHERGLSAKEVQPSKTRTMTSPIPARTKCVRLRDKVFRVSSTRPIRLWAATPKSVRE